MKKDVLQKTFVTNYILIGDKERQMEEAKKVVQKIEKESPYLFAFQGLLKTALM